MTENTQESSELMTLGEVARRFRVDTSTVRRWVRMGALEAITLPQRRNAKKQTYRIKRETVEKMLGSKP